MIIDSLTIRNFRCLHDVTIGFEPMTALLGRNGAGKSAVLHALEIFYDISAPISEEDFYDRDTSCQIEISVTYDHLREDEMAEFASYVFDDM